jgi:hypothetical protein
VVDITEQKCLLVSDRLLGCLTSQSTGASGGNQTDLLTGWCVTAGSRSVTDVLMVTTSVRMLYGLFWTREKQIQAQLAASAPDTYIIAKARERARASDTYIHSNTSNLGPLVALGLVLEVGTTSLHDGLVHATTTGDDTDGGTGERRDSLLGARRQLDTRLLGVWVVANDSGVVARGTSNRTTVAGLLFEVADNGTLGHATNRKNVSDSELGCKQQTNR